MAQPNFNDIHHAFAGLTLNEVALPLNRPAVNQPQFAQIVQQLIQEIIQILDQMDQTDLDLMNENLGQNNQRLQNM